MAFMVSQIKELLDLKLLNDLYDREVSGVFLSDMVSDVASGAQAGNLWVTVQTHKNIAPVANLVDISAVVITRGKPVPDDTLALAERAGISILSSSLETFDLVVKMVEKGVR